MINLTRYLCIVAMENSETGGPFFSLSWPNIDGQSRGRVSPGCGGGGGGSDKILCPSWIALRSVLNVYPTLKALWTTSICTGQLCFSMNSRYSVKCMDKTWLWSRVLDVCQLNSLLLQQSQLSWVTNKSRVVTYLQRLQTVWKYLTLVKK